MLQGDMRQSPQISRRRSKGSAGSEAKPSANSSVAHRKLAMMITSPASQKQISWTKRCSNSRDVVLRDCWEEQGTVLTCKSLG